MNGRSERNVIAFDPHFGTRTGWEVPARMEQLRREAREQKQPAPEWIERLLVYGGSVALIALLWSLVIWALMK